jgi:hypothetical protein
VAGPKPMSTCAGNAWTACPVRTHVPASNHAGLSMCHGRACCGMEFPAVFRTGPDLAACVSRGTMMCDYRTWGIHLWAAQLLTCGDGQPSLPTSDTGLPLLAPVSLPVSL